MRCPGIRLEVTIYSLWNVDRFSRQQAKWNILFSQYSYLSAKYVNFNLLGNHILTVFKVDHENSHYKGVDRVKNEKSDYCINGNCRYSTDRNLLETGMKLLISLAFTSIITLLLIAISAASESNGSWELYIYPEKYTLNLGEEMSLCFGLTGYGDIDPIRLKIVAYSENDTIIKYRDSTPDKNKNVFTIFPMMNETSTPTRYTIKEPRSPNYSIALQADHTNQFDLLRLHPQTSGNKKLTLIATYYVKGDGWKNSRCEIDYHVNSFTEEHQTIITIFTVIIGILSLSFLPSIGHRLFSSKKPPPGKDKAGRKREKGTGT